MAALLYGTGMRLMECIRLRVKDIDFAYRQIVVRDGKGQKDRVVPLPQRPVETLQQHLETVKRFHQADLPAGIWGRVSAARAGTEVSAGAQGMGLAVCLPQRPTVSRSA